VWGLAMYHSKFFTTKGKRADKKSEYKGIGKKGKFGDEGKWKRKGKKGCQETEGD